MSTLDAPQRVSKREDMRQDQVVTLYARAWQFFDQNRSLVWAGLAGVVVLVLIAIGLVFYNQTQEQEAEALLGAVVRQYEAGQYEQALEGGDTRLGLLAIADDFGGTEAGNLARFYAADALFKLGRYEEALDHFEAFDKEQNYIGASAIAGEAAAREALGEFDRAGDLYRQAAMYFESEVSTPEYLFNAGRAYERAGAFGEAAEQYQLLIDEYPDAAQGRQATELLYRARAQG